jgi:putative acetyltransferase
MNAKLLRSPLVEIRLERPEDLSAIRTLTSSAFQNAPHSSGTESAIVDALRNAGALTISLVAVDEGVIVGHIAFSPVTINGAANGWYGLGPVSVLPDRQRSGIGQTLIRTGLEHLRRINAQGCVVLGEPAYYGRFGFVCDPNLLYSSAPPEYFQRLAFTGTLPKGEVSYHPCFNAG